MKDVFVYKDPFPIYIGVKDKNLNEVMVAIVTVERIKTNKSLQAELKFSFDFQNRDLSIRQKSININISINEIDSVKCNTFINVSKFIYLMTNLDIEFINTISTYWHSLNGRDFDRIGFIIKSLETSTFLSKSFSKSIRNKFKRINESVFDDEYYWYTPFTYKSVSGYRPLHQLTNYNEERKPEVSSFYNFVLSHHMINLIYDIQYDSYHLKKNKHMFIDIVVIKDKNDNHESNKNINDEDNIESDENDPTLNNTDFREPSNMTQNDNNSESSNASLNELLKMIEYLNKQNDDEIEMNEEDYIPIEIQEKENEEEEEKEEQEIMVEKITDKKGNKSKSDKKKSYNDKRRDIHPYPTRSKKKRKITKLEKNKFKVYALRKRNKVTV